MTTSQKLVPLAAALALLAACPGPPGREDVSQQSPPKTSTTTSNPQLAPENSSSMNPVVPPQKDAPGMRPAAAATSAITVDLTEYEIRMPDTLPAGSHSFAVVNHGKENHSFEIEGNGVHQALTTTLTRGDSGQLVVDLKPGTYTVYCPVDGHKGKGMTRTLTVQ